MQRYLLFGLRAEVNVSIPGSQLSDTDCSPDLRIVLGELPKWVARVDPPERTLTHSSPYLDAQGVPGLRVWALREGRFYYLRYSDGTEFVFDSAGTQVWGAWPDTSTFEDTLTYLLGPVMGLVIRLRGTFCLHSSAVAIDGCAVTFAGHQGAGKSTTACAFATRGFRILSDDVVPLLETPEGIFVAPSHTQLRLWPDSVRALFGSEDALPRLTPTWDKRCYDVEKDGPGFETRPLPLRALYVLGERSDESRAPYVEEIAGQQRLIALVANTYVYYLLDREMRAREFKFLSRVVNCIPLRRVRPHRDPLAIARLCEVILEDYRAMNSSAPRRGEIG